MMGNDGEIYEFPKHPRDEDFGAANDVGMNDRSLFVYFKCVL